MSTTLYRKYRPQIFDDVVGQHHVRVTLQNELLSGRIAHAYLFTGPRGVGKTTMARLLAKAVNCLHPKKDGGPDNTCEACVEIRDGHSLDLIEIDAASNTGVDHVREHIIENARFTPSRWKYKIFIIDEVHMLSLSAFNALLKTLEEPPEHAIFILATTEVHKVPETIISRCQRFDFRQLRHEDLVERLRLLVKQEEVEVDDEVLGAIARFARGSARDAENLLGQVLTLGESPITMEQAELVLPRSDFHLVLELFEALVKNDATSGIRLVNRLVQDGVNLGQFTQNMIEFLRKALLLKVSPQLEMFSSLELATADEQKLLAEIENVKLDDLERMIRVFLSEEQHLRLSFVPQLPLELAVLEITSGDEPPVAVVQPAAPRRPIPVVPQKPSVAETNEPPEPPKGTAKKASQKSPAARLSLAEVQSKWGAVLERLQKASHSLRLTLNVAVLHDVAEGAIILGVGYDFHRERLELPRNRALIEGIFTEVFDQPVAMRTLISDQAPRTQNFQQEANVEMVDVAFDKPAPPPAPPDTPGQGNWEAIVEMFGGKPHV